MKVPATIHEFQNQKKDLEDDLRLISKLLSMEAMFALFMAILVLPLVLVLTMGATPLALAIWLIFIVLAVAYWTILTISEAHICSHLALINTIIEAVELQ